MTEEGSEALKDIQENESPEEPVPEAPWRNISPSPKTLNRGRRYRNRYSCQTVIQHITMQRIR